MNFPAKVYAIFTFDKNEKVDGVYIGASGEIETRLRSHLNCKSCASQKELHEKMRDTGYCTVILDSIDSIKDSYKEYEWIRWFKNHVNLKLYNTKLPKEQAE